jgi:hypothetical protein
MWNGMILFSKVAVLGFIKLLSVCSAVWFWDQLSTIFGLTGMSSLMLVSPVQRSSFCRRLFGKLEIVLLEKENFLELMRIFFYILCET